VPSGIPGTGGTDGRPPDIYTGYASVVRDQSEFIYEADITSVGGEDPDPGDDAMDEVVIGICNPTGTDPIVVNDIATCDAQGTGGTSGAGGAAGTGGGSTGGSSGGCSCDVATSSGSVPWLLILCLAGAALWLRRRRT